MNHGLFFFVLFKCSLSFVVFWRNVVMTFENNHAVRISDVATSKRGVGKGGSRKWLPSALLRAALFVCI